MHACRYWHICKALQMFPSDPRFSYDKYNDITRYRVTGELMEVSFQPKFKEGVPNGSSKEVITKRENYPADREQSGIGSDCSFPSEGIPGRFLGPSPEAWKVFLDREQNRKNSGKRQREVGFNVSRAGQGEDDMMEEDLEADNAPAPMRQVAGNAQAPQDQAPQQVEAQAPQQEPAPVEERSARPQKKQGRASKSSGMGLSSSYVPQSGSSASGVTGSVRASLLSSMGGSDGSANTQAEGNDK